MIFCFHKKTFSCSLLEVIAEPFGWSMQKFSFFLSFFCQLEWGKEITFHHIDWQRREREKLEHEIYGMKLFNFLSLRCFILIFLNLSEISESPPRKRRNFTFVDFSLLLPILSTKMCVRSPRIWQKLDKFLIFISHSTNVIERWMEPRVDLMPQKYTTRERAVRS